jgi:hypothetical protein
VADGHKQFMLVETAGWWLATEQNIGGDGHAIGKVRKGYEACIGKGGNKVQMSELCAGQSSEIFTQIVSALRNL